MPERGVLDVRIALHACCGPCLLEPFDALAAENEVVVVYANPNIQPADEYARRWDTLAAYAAANDIEVIEVAYDPGVWDAAAGHLSDLPRERCRVCYETRLSLSAAEAVSAGCEGLATTLSVSPYQDAGVLDEVGRAVAARSGLAWLGTDWRSRYPHATRRSRELDMYRQNYCGCLPSREEAQRSRAARRSGR